MIAEFAIAYDVPSLAQALALEGTLGEGPEWAKLGLELFLAEGPAVVRAFKDRGRRVFLDVKLHDIPNTVRGAAQSAARHGADLLTVHATGGADMIRAAVEGVGLAGTGTRVVAVTVLTSLDPAAIPPGFARPFDLAGTALALTRMALEAGAHGVVCAAPDLPALRAELGGGFLAVTPGIRLAGGQAHDQKRVATVEHATRAGASLLVLGRAITAAADPRAALLAAHEERRRALAQPARTP